MFRIQEVQKHHLDKPCMSYPTISLIFESVPKTHMPGHTHTCFCAASISSQMPGTTKVIILKIALLLFLHLPCAPLTPLALRWPV